MKYKCIKEMYLQKVDGDGFEIENQYECALVGSIWIKEDTSILGGEVHLESESSSEDFGWIEISKEDLKEFFVEV